MPLIMNYYDSPGQGSFIMISVLLSVQVLVAKVLKDQLGFVMDRN